MRLSRIALLTLAIASVPGIPVVPVLHVIPVIRLEAQRVPNADRALAIFKQLVEIDSSPAHGTTAAVQAMAARLRAAGFPDADIRIVGADPRKQNLVVRYRGTGARRPLLMLAHLDVVDARRDDWSIEPFALTEKDGHYYGRGTTDDKSMAAHFVANIIRLKEEGFRPDRDLILALTADEEGGDANGVKWLIANERSLIDAAVAINEGGGGIVRDGRYLINEVQAAEKVYVDLRLEVRNVGGHSSLPVRDNAIARLAFGLSKLSAYEFPIRMTEITRAYFERSASVQRDKDLAADMRQAGAAQPDARAIQRLVAFSPYFNAMLRTTCVPTRLEGGHANNALPQTAVAIVNCRLLPGDSPTAVRDRIREVIVDSAIEVTFVEDATPSAPATLMPDVMRVVEAITSEMFPGVVVVPSMSTGATDGLFLRNAGIPTFGIDGTFGDPDDVRAHGRDERIGIQQFYEGLEFQYRLLKRLSTVRLKPDTTGGPAGHYRRAQIPMPGHSLSSRAARGDARPLALVTDPDVLASHLEDAAHFPGGRATELIAPLTEADVAAALRHAAAVLPIGAQSSLTGGATPMGELLISTARMNAILSIERDRVRVQPGVPLAVLDDALRQAGRYYPPAPTFTGAFVGGTIATNAAGAATFKYGTTRGWVQAITVVLPSGDVLDIERGTTTAHPDGYFDLQLASRAIRVPVPRLQIPDVPKLSAGYFAANGMDLIDLFIGSEGTLGIVTEATLRIVAQRPAFCLALVPFRTRRAAMDLVGQLRRTAKETWTSGDVRGVDVSAVEHLDRRCLQIAREDRLDEASGITLADDADMVLLVTLELPAATTPAQAFAEIGQALDADAPDTPLVRFCRMLEAAGVLDDVEIAVPGDHARAMQLLALRESVPASVNQRIGRAHQQDPRVHKTAADMIVPFDHLEPLLQFYDDEFRRRGLDAAVWGHISDGNVHPNVIPRSFEDVESGREAILAFGREVIRLGGAPLAEHGVGRNQVKQRLLRELYGAAGIDDMRAVKRAIDPDWKLSPSVLFARR